MEILFIGKKDDANSEQAAKYLKQIFPKSEIVFGIRGQKLPENILNWKGDFIFSYLSPWVIPSSLLERANLGAINWHPGPPDYPGIGCTNFAIYNSSKQFGITCHYMAAKVDTGKIIEVRRFSVLDNDSVYSITQKCYALILNSFYSILEKIANGVSLTVDSSENWTRPPYTRKELDELCVITPEMKLEEIKKRIKATTYDRAWAFTEIQGIKFSLDIASYNNFHEKL